MLLGLGTTDAPSKQVAPQGAHRRQGSRPSCNSLVSGWRLCPGKAIRVLCWGSCHCLAMHVKLACVLGGPLAGMGCGRR